MTSGESLPDNDFDGPWKEVLDLYLEDAIALFFADAHRDIDWSRGYEGLETELQQVAPEGERGAQAVDKLIKVFLRDGTDAWVLIHLEVQSQQETSFEQRMFRYHARLYDHFRQEIVSLAILGDERPNWRPHRFRYGRWGSSIQFTFPTIKLLDYTEEELEASPFLCAIVVQAHRAAQATRHDPARRAAAKIRLVRKLYRRGLTREQIQNLYRFIDWLLRLPKELDDQTVRTIRAIEEEQGMTYVTSAERYGIEQGLAQGRAEGTIEGQLRGLLRGISAVLNVKFGAAGTEIMPILQKISDPARLEAILATIETAATLDEVRAFAEQDE
jgi:hypothetical protein